MDMSSESKVPIFCGPIIHRNDQTPSGVYFDVTILPNGLNNGEQLESLHFDNFYCSSLSLSQANGPSDQLGSSSFCTLYNYRMMADPGTETGAQDHFAIRVSDIGPDFHPSKPLRFTLFQPSPTWKSFDLRNITFLKKASSTTGASEWTDVNESCNIVDIMRADFKAVAGLRSMIK